TRGKNSHQIFHGLRTAMGSRNLFTVNTHTHTRTHARTHARTQTHSYSLDVAVRTAYRRVTEDVFTFLPSAPPTHFFSPFSASSCPLLISHVCLISCRVFPTLLYSTLLHSPLLSS